MGKMCLFNMQKVTFINIWSFWKTFNIYYTTFYFEINRYR